MDSAKQIGNATVEISDLCFMFLLLGQWNDERMFANQTIIQGGCIEPIPHLGQWILSVKRRSVLLQVPRFVACALKGRLN